MRLAPQDSPAGLKTEAVVRSLGYIVSMVLEVED